MPFYFCFVNNTESKLSRSSRIGVQDGDIAASRDLPLPVTGTFAGCQLRKGKKKKRKKKRRENVEPICQVCPVIFTTGA